MAVHEKSVLINAPVHKVFRMWRNWENFPTFMSHIKEVQVLEPGKTHWKAKINGIDEEWDAKTTKMEEDKIIAWESIAGLQNKGEIRFDSVDGGTKLSVHIEYKPPAGIIGQAVEAVYMGKEVEEDIGEDLQKFKERAESA